MPIYEIKEEASDLFGQKFPFFSIWVGDIKVNSFKTREMAVDWIEKLIDLILERLQLQSN